MTNTGFIIGAYPCAPSFHQKGEQEEQTFWRELSDTPYIRGLEQPCLENLHPLGDEWLFRHTPGTGKSWSRQLWKPCAAVASTAPLAWPADEEQRKACVDFYRHLHKKLMP
jgi:hypothetical protein